MRMEGSEAAVLVQSANAAWQLWYIESGGRVRECTTHVLVKHLAPSQPRQVNRVQIVLFELCKRRP